MHNVPFLHLITPTILMAMTCLSVHNAAIAAGSLSAAVQSDNASGSGQSVFISTDAGALNSLQFHADRAQSDLNYFDLCSYLVSSVGPIEGRIGSSGAGARWRYGSQSGGVGVALDKRSDAEVIDTRSWSLNADWNDSKWDISASLQMRQHDLSLDYRRPNLALTRCLSATAQDSFNSKGAMLDAGYTFDSQWRIGLGWTHYQYEQDFQDNPIFDRLTVVAASRVSLSGVLSDSGVRAGLDIPVGNSNLGIDWSSDHSAIDDSRANTVSIRYALSMGASWSLELSGGRIRVDVPGVTVARLGLQGKDSSTNSNFYALNLSYYWQ